MKEIKYSTVKITQDGITELEGNRESIYIPKKKIKTISLLFGCGVQRPLFQIILALALIIIPLYFFLPPFWELFSSLASSKEHGGGRALQLLALPLAFVPLGVWLFYDVFKKSYYFSITTDKKEKITFKEKVKKTDLQDFIEKAEKYYGYKINQESNRD